MCNLPYFLPFKSGGLVIIAFALSFSILLTPSIPVFTPFLFSKHLSSFCFVFIPKKAFIHSCFLFACRVHFLFDFRFLRVMEERKLPSPANVADAFVEQYFVILNKSPENLHKFYQEKSLLGWPGIDGVVTPVTTLKGINEKVMSSDYKNCSVEVKTVDAQESHDGGIIVAINGCLTGKDDVKKNFSQTFFLAKQEKGFFVLNDILRFFDVCTSITADSNKDDQPVPAQNSSPTGTRISPLDFKAAIQNGKVEEAPIPSLSANNLANGSAPTRSIWSIDASTPENAKKSAVAAATSDKVPSVVTSSSNVPQKITYASVLAKLIPAISPRSSKQTEASPTPKPSSPRGDISPKVSTPRGTSKATSFSSKVGENSPKRGQGAPSINAYSEAKGIYIGGLPYDITKQGIVNVLKQYGQILRHSETVQIRRHEDGFCCGFVEFESAESARRAVEAHRVMFNDKEAYVMYKRIPNNQGNNNRARSPTQRNGSSSGRVNDEWTYNTRGRGKVPHRSNSSDRWLSRDSVK